MLTNKEAERIIKLIQNHLENYVVEIEHVGEYDAKGWKHADSLCTIDSNVGRCVIWYDNIRFYPKDKGRAVDCTGTFDAFRYLMTIDTFKTKLA